MFKNNKKKLILSLLVILVIFALDRISKLYILNLAEVENNMDIYINSYLNFHLIWNTGIGFGLFSSENNFYYNLISILIFIINIIIIIMIFQTKDYRILFLTMILGGSLGNFFDRIYYRAVPDFIDLHYINFHWFIFNVADIFITIGIICLIIVEFILNNKQLDNETT
tara:strand:- start:296 stop:799 length:504 start_codon:yes stop_codon:yes gene_type:complete